MEGIRTPEEQAIDLWGWKHQVGKLGEEAGEVGSAVNRYLNALLRNDDEAIQHTTLDLDKEVTDLKRLIRQYEIIRGAEAIARADQITGLRFMDQMEKERIRRAA